MGQRGEIAKIVLSVVAFAGILAVAAVAPNCVQLLAVADKYQRDKKRRDKWYFNQVIVRLEKQGHIKIVKNQQGVRCVELTNKGEKLFERYEIGELEIKKPKRWDGKYRVIIFDIKEWKRSIRDQIRGWLEDLGFIKLQNSVWVYPYECREVIILLKSHLNVGQEVLYLTVESIENDKWLKRAFDLD